MGPKRRKIICNSCKKNFDDDYRKIRDEKYHYGKRQKVMNKGAPANPFCSFFSKKEPVNIKDSSFRMKDLKSQYDVDETIQPNQISNNYLPQNDSESITDSLPNTNNNSKWMQTQYTTLISRK